MVYIEYPERGLVRLTILWDIAFDMLKIWMIFSGAGLVELTILAILYPNYYFFGPCGICALVYSGIFMSYLLCFYIYQRLLERKVFRFEQHVNELAQELSLPILLRIFPFTIKQCNNCGWFSVSTHNVEAISCTVCETSLEQKEHS